MELTFLLNYLGFMTSSLCEGAQLLWLHDILLMSQSSFSCSITLVHDILLMSWSSILTQLIWLHNILLMSRSSLSYLITLAPWHLTYVIELTFFLNHFGSMTSYLCQEALFLFVQSLWLHDILLMSWNSLFCSITLAAGHFAYVMELNCLLNYFGCTTSCLYHGSQFFT